MSPEVSHRASMRIAGQERDCAVLRFEVHESLSLPHEARVTLEIEGQGPDTVSLLGKQAVLEWSAGEVERTIHGLVESVSRTGERDGNAIFELVMRHRIARLSRTRSCRVFGRAALPDAVRRVMYEAGFGEGVDFELAFGETHLPRNHLVQYHESDLDFLTRLLAEEGALFRLDPTRIGNPVIFMDGSSPLPVLETASIPLLRGAGGIGSGEHAPRLLIHSTATAGSVRLRDHRFEAPHEAPTERRSSDGQSDGLEWFEFIDCNLEADAVAERTRRRLEAEVSRGPRISGSTALPSPVPGYVSRFEGLPDPEVRRGEDNHIFVTVEHAGGGGLDAPLDARGATEGYTNTFEAAPIKPPFRMLPSGDRPRIRGIQTAFVVGPQGQEGKPHVDEHGRVKLRFHWQDDFKLDTAPWVRVSQALAGPNWGFLALPRVGHEVLVAFADGDPERPIVIGSLFNGEAVPPQKLPDHAARTTLRSRSLADGSGHHELVFDDTAGRELLSIRAERDRTLLVRRDDAVEIQGKSDTRVGGDRTSTVKGADRGQARVIELEAREGLTLRCGASTIRIMSGEIRIDAPIVKINS